MSIHEAIVTFDTDKDGAVTGIRHASASFYNAVSDEMLDDVSPKGMRYTDELENWGERLITSAARRLDVIHMLRDNHRTVVARWPLLALDPAA